MNKKTKNLELLNSDLNKTKNWFKDHLQKLESTVHIYTHLDADGLSAGAILGKALYREKIPFQITVLRQLDTGQQLNFAENSKDSKK